MKILCLGDVVGRGAVLCLQENLRKICRETGAEITVINGENASMGSGNGISKEDAELLFEAGADVITGGNHSFRQRSVYGMLDEAPTLLRPCNYPGQNPGKGSCILSYNGKNILFLNVMGRIGMENLPLACPFESCRKILLAEKGNYDLAVLDIHAEATSEKIALAYDLCDKVNIIFGTHTHVPTADEQILQGRCGYITDLGMCGPRSSNLGVKTEIIIEKLKTGMPSKFELSENPVTLEGALFTLSDDHFRCTAVERVRFDF